MPWRECSVMDERVRLIGHLLDGEGMSELCRAFGISRKTAARSSIAAARRGSMRWRTGHAGRFAMPTQLTGQAEAMVVRLKREKPHWGAARFVNY